MNAQFALYFSRLHPHVYPAMTTDEKVFVLVFVVWMAFNVVVAMQTGDRLSRLSR